MPASEVFGTIIHPRQIGVWVQEHLQAWLPTYLGEMERQTGRSARALPLIRSWELAPDIERWPENQLPSLVVIVPGTAGDPDRDGAGNYSANFNVDIGLFVSANTEQATEELVSVYAAAVIGAVTQHDSMGDKFAGSWWRGTDFTTLGDDRTLGVARIAFGVNVTDLINTLHGPLEPLEDPYVAPPGSPTVKTGGAIITTT